MYPLNKYKLLDWIGRSLCVLIPVCGVCVIQQLSAAGLTVDALAEGRWLTVWSGHLLHFTVDHFVWDALVFVIFSALLWPKESWRMWLWLVGAAPIISLFVFWVEPGLYEYRGLSALDTMLCVRFFVEFFKCRRRWPRWLFGVLPLLGLSLKIGYELIVGQTLFVTDLGAGVVPLPSAHLAGLVLGLLWGVLTVEVDS